jgi:dTDP-4-amino-4,6-dideoxygalactose transaminase
VSEWRIPFNRPALVGNELLYVRQAVEGGHLSGDGVFSRRCSQLLEEWLGVGRAMLTPSATHALEMCALLLEFEPGDEFIVPSFAFVTTANAFVLRGGRPAFVDVRPDTLNLDETKLRGRITARTKAIVALHYAGVACEMDAIQEISRETGVPVVEDNAHGLFGTYRGRLLGTFGCLAVQSFHETKNFTCGEGGALMINRPDLVERAEILREKGTDRARFFRGQIDRYTWVDLGSSYLPSELQAAFLYGQLEVRERVQTRRAALCERYHRELGDWATRHAVGLPQIPVHCEPPHHLFYLILPTPEARRALSEALAARGILAPFHYQPLHLSAMGRRFGGRPGQCPVTERVSELLLRLPLYNGMTDAEQAEVIEAVRDFGP